MPRLSILTTKEQKEFDKPPAFKSEDRKKYFNIDGKLRSLIKNIKSTTNRICMVIQWGYFRATGRFFMINDFRSADVKFVSRLLDINYTEIDLVDYRDKRKTYRKQQLSILKLLNFQAFDDKAKELFRFQVENLISKQMQPREIIYHVASLCYQKQIEIPTYHYFSECITNCYNENEAKLLALVKKHITKSQINRLESLLDKNEKEHHPLIFKWKSFDQKLEVKHIRASLKLFFQVKEFFYKTAPLLEKLNLNKNSCEYYATWVTKAKLSQLKQMPDKTKLYLHLAAFVQHQFYARQDHLIDIFLKSVNAVANQVKKKRAERDKVEREKCLTMIQQLSNEKNHLESLIVEISEIVNENNVSDRKKINEIKSLLQQHRIIQEKINKEEQVNQEKFNQLLNDDIYYDMLEDLSRALQNRVSGIVKAIDFDTSTSDPSILEAIDYYKSTNGDIKNDAPISHLESKQQEMCFTNDNKLRISLYKILLFMRMFDCIKSGDLNIKYSYKYQAIQDYLISVSSQ